jgi:hypothetical protein
MGVILVLISLPLQEGASSQPVEANTSISVDKREALEEGPGKVSGSRLGEDLGAETATGEEASWLTILQKDRHSFCCI